MYSALVSGGSLTARSYILTLPDPLHLHTRLARRTPAISWVPTLVEHAGFSDFLQYAINGRIQLVVAALVHATKHRPEI